MPSRSEIYCQKASKCLSLAARAPDGEEKEKLLATAKKWQLMADDAKNEPGVPQPKWRGTLYMTASMLYVRRAQLYVKISPAAR
jgi:hypothetical protein